VIDKFREIWDSQWLSNNGPKHQILEEELKKYLKVPHLSLFNNGTNALLSASRSLDLTGEVITTPFTFAATPHSLTWNNLEPVFADIDDSTLNIDPTKIEELITKDTSAILGVHVFGTPCDVDAINKIAKKHKLKVIYDAAHAFGVEINGRGIGTYGDTTIFSFHPTKLFHTGEGGALTYKTKELKNRNDLMKNFGIKNEEEVVLPGINGKMSEIQASLGLVVLNYIEDEMNHRKELEQTYRNELKNVEGVSFIQDLPNVKKSYQYLIIRINSKNFGKTRDKVYKEFKKYNVFARKYFFPLCSNYEHYKGLPSAKPERLPVANTVVEETLCMPFYGGLTKKDVIKICDILRTIRNE
ncbi:DegT/DnrJ/EryC1/StrS family aminotransferase, partial [Candidatus Dojkabacteria bacterium]|nr:DegT/DnrJ/EryC1/StrS family aminotransferase [Candidatus Dojkabacteria bacterium]